MVSIMVAVATAINNPVSVAGYLVDAVDHAREVAQQLEQEGPQHFPAQPIVDEHGQERQEETQNDQENLAHRTSSSRNAAFACPRQYPRGDRLTGSGTRQSARARGQSARARGQSARARSQSAQAERAGNWPAVALRRTCRRNS